MNRTHKHFIGIINAALLLFILPSSAQQLSDERELVDRVAAVVGNEAILESEINMAVYSYQFQNRMQVSDPEELTELKREILDKIIENKILVREAQKLEIEIRAEDIERGTDQFIEADVMPRYGTQEAFEKQMKIEGMTLGQLKRRYEKEIREQMLVQRLKTQKFASATPIIESEVRQFYEAFKDSLPRDPAKVHLAQIFLSFSFTGTLARIDSIKSRLDAGEDFGELAKTYSQDPGTAEAGGDLGFFSRGTMAPTFEEAAFALAPGQVSDLVETQFGFHLIKLEEKDGDRIKARHILIPRQADPLEKETLTARAEELRAMIEAGGDFAELAQTYSEDPQTKDNGGDMGDIPEGLMPEIYALQVNPLQPGQISQPVVDPFGVRIFTVLDRKEERSQTYDEMKESLKQMIRQQREEERLSNWVTQRRKDTYIVIYLEELEG